jgi:hypothetical protein
MTESNEVPGRFEKVLCQSKPEELTPYYKEHNCMNTGKLHLLSFGRARRNGCMTF